MYKIMLVFLVLHGWFPSYRDGWLSMCCKNVFSEAVGINYKLIYNIYVVVIDCSVMQNSQYNVLRNLEISRNIPFSIQEWNVEEYGKNMFECFF